MPDGLREWADLLLDELEAKVAEARIALSGGTDEELDAAMQAIRVVVTDEDGGIPR